MFDVVGFVDGRMDDDVREFGIRKMHGSKDSFARRGARDES